MPEDDDDVDDDDDDDDGTGAWTYFTAGRYGYSDASKTIPGLMCHETTAYRFT